MEYSALAPMSISTAFDSEEKVKDFLVTLIEELHRLREENSDKKDYIPPVIFHEHAKVYNVDYNFLISVLAYHVGDQNIVHDFSVKSESNVDNIRNAHFLVRGILEDYYRVVRVNNFTIDTSRYRSAKTIDLKPRYCNVLGMKFGRNLRLFSAVPFTEVALAKMIESDVLRMLDECAVVPQIEQIFFGESKHREFLRTNRIDMVAPVF